MNPYTEQFVNDAISGIMSVHRAVFRAAGAIPDQVILISVPLTEIQSRVQLRLDGLLPLSKKAKKVTIQQIRAILEKIPFGTIDDHVVVGVYLPKPRKAHAR